ncbi:MAG: L,D-transpeptidase [Proteobacteria bacterium]|nr:L,D-transpeptidase [Pseudomonadota bacterium]
MNKYVVLLLTISVLFSFKSNAAYNDGRYARRHVQWVCNPYKHVCYRVSRPEGGYYPYEYRRHKYNHKKNVVKNTEPKHIYLAPPEKIEGRNIINVNLAHGTWGAYDEDGNLIKSGHVSGGKSFCPDINKKCKTVTGTFKVYDKKGSNCKSKIFPVGKGGAPMPYCMFFHEGYALHGSNAVPNYNASHGCVRMAPADAKWLNENFVKVGVTRVNVTYEKTKTEEEKEPSAEKSGV